MRWLIDISVRRPVAVAMFYCAVALLAAAAWVNLPVDVVPQGEFPTVTVSTSWAGASPESVQSLVTSRIEALAVTIPGVQKVSARSSRGLSQVIVEFQEDAKLDLARFELSDRLSMLRDELPPATGAPTLRLDLPREFAELQGGTFLSFAVRATRPLNALRQLAKEDILPALQAVNGVSEVMLSGGQDPHLRVTLDPAKLELYSIPANAILVAIRDLDRTDPVGQIEVDGTAFILRIDHRLADLEPLRTLPIRQIGNRLIRLGDLATVSYGFARAESYTRVNGEAQVVVTVQRKAGTDVLGVAAAVRARLQRLETDLPTDVSFEIQQDEAADLEAELRLVSRRLVLVLVLVAALLIVLLRDLRSAPLLFVSIGAALAITVVALYHLQVPVNVLTLTGLALAFGMLVDNAVVVLENIMRYREAGTGAIDAARRGTAEVVTPVLASTLTTVGVFFPFVYFQGRMRDYFTPLALAIAFALTASLLVSMTLMPAVAGRGWLASRVRGGSAALPRFRRALGFGLRHPWIVLVLAAGAWYGSYQLFENNVARGDFFRWFGSSDRIFVSLTLQSGAEASRTEAAIRPFEQYVLAAPDIERSTVQVLGNSATMQVEFAPAIEASGYPLLVKDELIRIATRYAGLRVSVSGFDNNFFSSGFGSSANMGSRIKLYGYNYERLGDIGEQIATIARRSARVQEANVTAGGRSFWRDQGAELGVRILRDELAGHGLTVEDVRRQLVTLLRGRTSQDEIRVGSQQWDLLVKVDGADRRSLQEVLDTPLRSESPSSTRLRDVLEVSLQRIPGEITREDQRYDRYAQWEYRGSSRASTNYRQAIFDSLELPPGYSAALDDSFRLTQEEQLQIRNVALLALAIVFMVLASLYESFLQPFVVLLAVPGSLIGVFLIFYFAGKPFDASASIGVVLLGGIVVNNAILLVDHINLRRSTLPLIEAIVTGAAERVRPILITSITTVGGMLPLVLIESTERAARASDIWTTLALSTIGGLTASTLLTLTLTPILYLLAERWRQRAGAFSRHMAAVWRSLPA